MLFIFVLLFLCSLALVLSVHAGMFQYSCALIFVPSRVSFPVCAIHWFCLCASLYFLSVSPVYALRSYLGLCMYVSPCFYCLRGFSLMGWVVVKLFVILLCIYLLMFSLCLHKVDADYNLVMNSMNTNLRLPLTLRSAKDQNQTI